MSINLDYLNGRVITFESTKYLDWFIDTRDKAMDEACLSPLPVGKRQGPYTDPGAQTRPSQWQLWKVHVRGNGRVSFESTERPDHYLDLNHRKGWGGMHAISVTWCATIRSVGNWGQFKIHGTMDDATIQCMRWEDRWLVAHSMMRVMGGKYGSAPPADSYDGWGHWTIKDVFAKPAADEAAQGNARTIVHKEWVDSYADLEQGSEDSQTIGLDVGTGSDTTIGNETTMGMSVMVGFEAVATGEVTVNVENTTSVYKTNSVSLNNMKEYTKSLEGPGPGTKKYTAFWLTVTFDDGEYMKVIGKLVPTDRSGGSFEGEFNPAKLPKMMSDKAILGAIRSAFQ